MPLILTINTQCIHTHSCWLSVKEHVIWAFIIPMLMIIMVAIIIMLLTMTHYVQVNIFFFVAVLFSVYRSKKLSTDSKSDKRIDLALYVLVHLLYTIVNAYCYFNAQITAQGISDTTATTGTDMGVWITSCQSTNHMVCMDLLYTQLTTGILIHVKPIGLLNLSRMHLEYASSVIYMYVLGCCHFLLPCYKE